jgi:hypothetical protein
VEYYDKKTAATAKGGITRNMTACQKILDYLDEWKESNLARAMLSNRKNHTALELTLAADERKSKEYARLATEMKAKKKLTNPTSQLKKSAIVEKHDSSLINKSEKKGDSSEDESDSAEYNDANSGDEDVKIDWTKKFHTKQRKTTAWDVIASGEYRVSNYFDANAKLKGRLEPPERITMRAIISTISKIYDPLGMADPVTITGRMIGQSLWGFVKTLKTDWDTVLDNREDEEVQAVMNEWEKHFIQLTQLSQLEMSRALTDGSQKSFTIHIFGDGSKLAYAAVAYIRVVYNDRVEVKFICAKKNKCAQLKCLRLL